jgi:hypothetical protein
MTTAWCGVTSSVTVRAGPCASSAALFWLRDDPDTRPRRTECTLTFSATGLAMI